jgi:hypothetical protein
MLQHELPDRVKVIAPDRVDEVAGEDKTWPARRLIAARQNELRVGELRVHWIDLFRVIVLEVRDRGRITSANLAK